MTNIIEARISSTPVFAVLCCLSLFSSASVYAGAAGTHYANQSQQAKNKAHYFRESELNDKHYQSWGKAGQVKLSDKPRLNSSNRSNHRHHKKQSRQANSQQHNVQGNHSNEKHNHSRRKAGQVTHNDEPRHNSSNKAGHRQYGKHDRHRNYQRYSSPRNRYYQRPYSRMYTNSRFPNRYQVHNFRRLQPYTAYTNYNILANNGWDKLIQGDIRRALKEFDADTRAYPKAGIPQLGYALSSAASGQMRQSVSAMRRAFRIDSESIRYYRFDYRLYPLIDEILNEYGNHLTRRTRQYDAAFMIAALSYLTGDYLKAEHSLRQAIRFGELDRGLKNLKEFINAQHVSSAYTGKYRTYRY